MCEHQCDCAADFDDSANCKALTVIMTVVDLRNFDSLQPAKATGKQKGRYFLAK